MKYRIKIKTFVNGRQEFQVYVKQNFFQNWLGLSYDGKATIGYSYIWKTRERALQCLDAHLSGNTTVKKVDFEYINK